MQGLRPAAFAFPKLGAFAALLALACALSVAVLAVMPATAHAAPSDRGYTWPFKIDGYLSQDFKGSAHGGTDLGAPMGTNVYACADGIVKYVQKWDGHSTYDMQSYGNLVIIYHPGARTATYYAHLQSFNVKKGQMVRQGTKIGKVGSTGNSTGPHLHIEFRTNALPGLGTYGYVDGTRQNPMWYMDSAHKFGGKVKTSLSNGTYIIHASGKTSYVLGIRGGSRASGANCELAAANVGKALQFKLRKNSDRSYTIINARSGMALDLERTATASGVNVCQRPVSNADSQHWFIEKAGGSAVYLRNKYSRKYLDVYGATYAKGSNIWQYTCNASKAQKFYLSAYAAKGKRSKAIATGSYTLRAARAGSYVVATSTGTMRAGSNVKLYKSGERASQVFYIQKTASGFYKIYDSPAKRTALAVKGAKLKSLANVQMSKVGSSRAQLWILRSFGGGVYGFQNLKSGYYLDIYGCQFESGTNISQYIGNGSVAQKFKLKMIAAPAAQSVSAPLAAASR